jgi:ABC-type nitrate/sulfonate/bicarbonate transport system substrate-binding protein
MRSFRAVHSQPLCLLLLLCVVILMAACSNGDTGGVEPTGEQTTEPADGETTEPTEPTEVEEFPVVRVGATDSGSGGILWSFIAEQGLDEKHMLEVDLTVQSSIGTLYDDFAAGRYDIVQAVPSGLLPMAAAGVPVQILLAYSPVNTFLVSTQDLTIPEDLEGLRIAGITRSGSFRQAAALLNAAHGVDINANAVPADSNLAAVGQVVAGTADAAIVWEADNTLAMNQHEGLQVIWGVREAYQEEYGGDVWSSVFGYRTDAEYSDDTLDRFKAMIEEATVLLQSDHDLVDQMAQELLDAPEGVYREAFSSGRWSFEFVDVNAEVEADMRQALGLEMEHGDLEGEIPETFFG